MRASKLFIDDLLNNNIITEISTINIELFGSLAYTGIGHGTDKALIMGLIGYKPESIDPKIIKKKIDDNLSTNELSINNKHKIFFDSKKNISYNKYKTDFKYSNAMIFSAVNKKNDVIYGCI